MSAMEFQRQYQAQRARETREAAMREQEAVRQRAVHAAAAREQDRARAHMRRLQQLGYRVTPRGE